MIDNPPRKSSRANAPKGSHPWTSSKNISTEIDNPTPRAYPKITQTNLKHSVIISFETPTTSITFISNFCAGFSGGTHFFQLSMSKKTERKLWIQISTQAISSMSRIKSLLKNASNSSSQLSRTQNSQLSLYMPQTHICISYTIAQIEAQSQMIQTQSYNNSTTSHHTCFLKSKKI